MAVQLREITLALPQLVARLNPAAVILLVVGGLAYTAGAIVYARRRPDPAPSVFGYHELFHALTIVAVTCQYVAIGAWVVARWRAARASGGRRW